MNELIITGQPGKKITSLEISELVEKRHDNAKRRIGSLYLIQSKCGSLTKIGRSVRPEQRISEIANMAGGVGDCYVSNIVTDAVAIESVFHNILKRHREKGEWFRVKIESIRPVFEEICNLFVADINDLKDRERHDREKGERIFKKMASRWGIVI